MALFGNSWIDQVKKILPPSHRSQTIVDYLSSLLEGVQEQDDDMEQREADLVFLAHTNSQIMVLKEYLEQTFGVANIRVETNTSSAVNTYTYNEGEPLETPVYSFNEGEGEPPLYIFNESEPVEIYDFTVKVPSGSYTTQLADRITAVVTDIGLSGMIFNVVSY